LDANGYGAPTFQADTLSCFAADEGSYCSATDAASVTEAAAEAAPADTNAPLLLPLGLATLCELCLILATFDIIAEAESAGTANALSAAVELTEALGRCAEGGGASSSPTDGSLPAGVGDPTCFSAGGAFTAARCCSTAGGLSEGDPTCWGDGYTYERCCTGGH
jgi:hypothetical protein